MDARFSVVKAKQLPNPKIIDDRRRENDFSAYEGGKV